MNIGMKTINKYILMVAASIFLAACSQDDVLNNSYLDDTDAVHILAQVGSNGATGGFTSRSNPLGTDVEQTKFAIDDELSVVADNQEAVVYCFDGTSWKTKNEGAHLLWNSDEMTFKAFYPANSNGASLTNFTLPTAYNSLEDIAKGDYMTFSGSRKRNSSDNSVSLEMQRKMVRIVVNVSGWGNTMPKGLVVNEISIHPNTKGYHEGELIAANSEDTSVKAYKHTDEKFYALITPTTEEAKYNEKLFMTVKVSKADGSDEQEFRVNRLPPNGTVAGNSYEYSLQIGKNAIEIKNISVTDWTKGEAIPGGEALGDAEFIKKTIAEALEANQTDIELTLPASAGIDVFDAIRESFDGVTAGSIDLTLNGCEEIPARGLTNEVGQVEALKSISLPNVTKIGKNGLYACVNMEEIYAPNVTTIEELALAKCKALKKVTFGVLTDVKGDDNNTDGIFYDIDNVDQNIDLVLSESQKELTSNTVDGRICWTPSEPDTDYKNTEGYKNRLFLGITFKSVTLQ